LPKNKLTNVGPLQRIGPGFHQGADPVFRQGDRSDFPQSVGAGLPTTRPLVPKLELGNKKKSFPVNRWNCYQQSCVV